MLILFSFRRSFDGDLPVLTCYLTRWCCHCHSLSAWTKSPEVERTSFWEREAWKVYLDDGQFEELDKVVADCENADDNYEPAARHLKHEQVFSKMLGFDHIAYKTYSTLSLPLPSNFDVIAQWSSIYWTLGGVYSLKILSKVPLPNLSQCPAVILDQYQHCRSQTINYHELLSS